MSAYRSKFGQAVQYSIPRAGARAVIGATIGATFHGSQSRGQSALQSAGRSVKIGIWSDAALASGRAGHRYYKSRKGGTPMAKKKGSWKGGKAPAQGGTRHKMSKPERGQYNKPAFSKGRKKASKKGGSPLDGRKRGKK